ncbi:MAG: GLPGLI family protein [Muribaculaceae bacterium]|nr:GLPGLI family protein [Muribaculaceae bacterium]
MKQILTSIIMCFAAMAAMAQTADIEVSYRYSHPVQTMKSAEPDVTNQYILLSDGNQSKFYSPKTEFIDSIESTPEGFEKFNTFKRVCYEKKQSDQIPRVDGSFYITKSVNDDKMLTYDIASATKFRWEEKMPHIEWNVTDSTMDVMGYECFMAIADYHGRKWTAWFAPEIPVSDGPWKLCGLPGIILQAECDGGQYRFVADGIQQVHNPEYRVYGKEKWEPIKREEFWQLRRECLDNPSRNSGTGGNTIVYKGINYIKYLPKEVVDYIETDY